MKITKYTEIINDQLKSVIDKKKLIPKQLSDYNFRIENDLVAVEFFTEYRSDTGIGIFIEDKKKNMNFQLFDVKRKKSFKNNDFLNQNEKEEMALIEDQIEKIIYSYCTFLIKHCQDLLSGDFSSLMKN